MSNLDQPATHRELAEFRSDMNARFDEMRRHFDVVSESFKTEFRNLFDWVHATTSSQATRLDHLEQAHGARLDAAELRLTHLERRK